MAFVTNSVHFIDSDFTTDFRTAIPARAAGTDSVASAYADIQIAQGSQSVGGNKLIIQSVRILSLQRLDWRVQFWERSVPTATSSNLNNWGLLGSVDVYNDGASNTNVGGAYYATCYAIGTLFAYIAENLNIPYHDKTGQGQLHVNLGNLNTGTAKSAGDVGAVHLRVGTIAAS